METPRPLIAPGRGFLLFRTAHDPRPVPDSIRFQIGDGNVDLLTGPFPRASGVGRSALGGRAIILVSRQPSADSFAKIEGPAS
jgi:hypothetical protein